VALGYATTVHGVQGATVDEGRGHGMPDSAEALYVVLTRGRSRNEVSHIQEEPSHDNPEPRRETAMEAATRAMENRTAELSATDLLRRDQDLAESMLNNGPKWIEMQELGRRSQLDRHMAGLLGPDLYARLNGEDPSSLYRLVRSAELDGHDPKKLLEEAVAWRELPTAHTLPSVLHWRLTEKILPERQPDLAPTGPTYPERTLADLPARDREWTLTVANQLEERKAALGERAAAEPPPWALDRLGPVPEDPIARLDWTQRAGTVAAYREWYGRNLAPGDVLGTAPAPAMVEQHRDWREAHKALGLDVDARQLAEATDAQLLLRVKQYERAREWAPREVSDVMRETYVAVDEMELSVKETRYKARTVADPAEREQAERLLAAYELMGDFHAGQTEQLEKINAAYDEWHAGTARERETAYGAQAELDRRAELAPKEAPDADEAYAVDPEPVDLDAWWEALEREAADREAEQDLDQAPEPDTGPELDPAAEQEPVDVEQDQDVTPEPEDLEPQAEAEQEPVDVEQAEELDPDAVADQPADVEQDQDVEPAAAPEPDEPGPAVDVDPAAAEQDVEPTAEAEQQPVDVAPEAEAVPEELWEADLAAADHRPDVDLDEPDPETVPVLETEAAPATAPEVEPELDLAAEVDRAQAALDQLAAQRAARAAVEAEAAAERTAAWAARERPALDATVQRTQTPSMGIERE
ncbi:hypothetical protein AB0M43_38385, partial [Longispora sp. NPDC051575]